MTDIESRLRAAMRSVTDQPPAGLMGAVRRRHRRHRERVAVGCAAAVLAIAIGAQPVAQALRAPDRSQPSSTGRVQPGGRILLLPAFGPPKAAAGTVLAGCSDANVGSIGADWRTSATRLAGRMLWFISAGKGSAGTQALEPGVMIITGATPGRTVIVKVTSSGRGRLKFLYGPHDSLGPGTKYTMRDGEDGVTFVACPAGAGPEPEPRNVTIYYGAFLYNGCVPVNVWLPGRRSPVRARLGNCG